MNANGKNGKRFIYREMGVEWLVTQLEHVVKGDKHEFKFRVEHIIHSGGMPKPPIGHVLNVMRTEGYDAYVGWSVEETEEDPFEEREYPLRRGFLIRSPEGVLGSKSSPDAIPITTDAGEEIDAVLDAYGDALDKIEKLTDMADKVLARSLERKTGIELLLNALKKIEDEMTDDDSPRAQRINRIILEAIGGMTKDGAK